MKPWKKHFFLTPDKKGGSVVVDNREYPDGTNLKDISPLLAMKIGPRFTKEELSEYADIIVDRLNNQPLVDKLMGK